MAEALILCGCRNASRIASVVARLLLLPSTLEMLSDLGFNFLWGYDAYLWSGAVISEILLSVLTTALLA